VALAALMFGNGANAIGEPPTFAQQRVYFHCNGTTKAGNINYAAQSTMPGWNTTAPAASVTSGAGCGTADPGVVGAGAESQNLHDAAWQGTFTGNIQAITVEAHTIYVGSARGGVTNFGLAPKLFVDGSEVSLSAAFLTMRPVPSATAASEKVLFSISGLNIVDDADGDGIADPGPGTTEHTVTLQLAGYYFNSTLLNAWVYDTTEVPAGITFNPATLESARLSAAQ
jgi:hypothetical protein